MDQKGGMINTVVFPSCLKAVFSGADMVSKVGHSAKRLGNTALKRTGVKKETNGIVKGYFILHIIRDGTAK